MTDVLSENDSTVSGVQNGNTTTVSPRNINIKGNAMNESGSIMNMIAIGTITEATMQRRNSLPCLYILSSIASKLFLHPSQQNDPVTVSFPQYLQRIMPRSDAFDRTLTSCNGSSTRSMTLRFV